MYKIRFDPEFTKTLDKVKKKSPKEHNNILKKIKKIKQNIETNPDHCKNLRKPLQKYKRVHVNDSHVLIFEVNKLERELTIMAYAHHDKIYNKKSLF